MIYFGGEVLLERILESDLETLRQWRNHYAVRRWCRQNDLISEQAQKAWFQKINNDSSIEMYRIRHKQPGDGNFKIVGVCGLTSIETLPGSIVGMKKAEFSLYIAHEHQKKGYSKNALMALLSHGFLNLKMEKIWGEVFQGNPALGIFESLGFEHLETKPSSYFKEGKWTDSEIIELKKSTWFLDDRYPKKEVIYTGL